MMPWFRHSFPRLVAIGAMLIVGILNCFEARGQAVSNVSDENYLIAVWDSDRGLPQNSVVSLAQTPDGYLWVGTLQAGLARFDGVHFVRFDPANTPQLPQIEIQKLMVDSQGVLWIATVGGQLARYQAGRFTFESGFPVTRQGSVGDLVLSTSNEVYFAVRNGLAHGIRRPGTNSLWTNIQLPDFVAASRFGVSDDGRIWYRRADQRLGCWRDGAVEPLHSYEGLNGEQVRALASDADGRLWVGTEQGLFSWANGRFVNMTPTNGEPNVAVEDFVFAADGGMWVRTAESLRKCMGQQWIAEAQGWPGMRIPATVLVSDLHSDREGGVWFRYRNMGVWHVRSDGTLDTLNDRNGLPNGLVDCLMQDEEGNVWLGLEGGGLVRVRSRHFKTLPHPESMAGAVVRSVCEDAHQAVWLGDSDGKIFHWYTNSIQELALPRPRVPVRDVTLWPDSENGMWIGTVQNGAWLWKNGVLRHPFSNAEIGTVVRVLFKDSRGSMWLGNEFGLYCWSGGKLKKFGKEQGFPDDAYVLALAEGADEALWIGTANGRLWRYKAGIFDSFALPAASPDFRFWSVLAEPNGVVWVGTLGGGLLRWKKGQLTRCTSADGLPSDTISQLLEDRRGNLWAGSSEGIFAANRLDLNRFFDGHEKNIFCRTFGHSDGLPALECSAGYQPACWQGADGRLWFATVKGAVFVDPQKLPVNPLAPKVVIEELRSDGVAQKAQSSNSPVTLGPGRHYVQFGFTGISLTAPERVRFQWNLEGLDNKWVDGGDQRSVNYSYLPPGDYTFHVRACNSDGVWNMKGAAFNFRVLPHLWETWWFHLFAPILGIAISGWILFQIFRRRHRLQMERVEQQRSVERERTRIAQDLHDDLGASLTQVAWLGEVACSDVVPADECRKLVTEITGKSREMLRAIDEIVWAVNPKNDSLDHLVTYLCECANQMFRNSATRCRVDVPEIVPVHQLSSDIRHNLFLAAKEALHNVAKHAGANQVLVRVTVEHGLAKIFIEDDGRGFVIDQQTNGDGLENMRQRSRAIGVNFTLRSTPGQGTIAVWTLPLESDRIT